MVTKMVLKDSIDPILELFSKKCERSKMAAQLFSKNKCSKQREEIVKKDLKGCSWIQVIEKGSWNSVQNPKFCILVINTQNGLVIAPEEKINSMLVSLETLLEMPRVLRYPLVDKELKELEWALCMEAFKNKNSICEHIRPCGNGKLGKEIDSKHNCSTRSNSSIAGSSVLWKPIRRFDIVDR
ncbi:19215_t:CDS:2 [Gigaspora margarita]|uniref:19215_t:CDS:1 n=1 Tax=Gigaspora margarita TaxID=4874 RepID=A0ABN7V6A4_GIGMA|nr:19215_t:CDS:2 [Gigaspora margarita]